MSGKLVYHFPEREETTTEVKVEVFSASPDKWRLILISEEGRQQMGYDGENGWMQNLDRIILSGSQRRSRLAYLFNPHSPLIMEEYFPQMMLAGREDVGGASCIIVKNSSPDGGVRDLYFDEESGLLVRIGENLDILEYRERSGVKYPAVIAIKINNGTATYDLTDMGSGEELEENRFRMPSLDEVFPEDFAGLEHPLILPLLKNFPSGHEDMNVPSRDGRFLHDLIVEKGYKRGIEIGSFTGYSALWLGMAFQKTKGTLVTIEIDQGPGLKARDNIRNAALEDVVDVRIADAFKEIPAISGKFDFVFIDAWKPDYIKFLRLLRDRMIAGGVIVAHNVTNYARDMQDFISEIKGDSGLETTFNELSEEGMSISFVRKQKK